jgi:hypothetical protein
MRIATSALNGQAAVLAVQAVILAVQGTPLVNVARGPPADTKLVTDIAKISRSWGQISTYADNSEDYFGVCDVGLPSGCQVEQAQLLQRHANRFPTGGSDDGGNDQRFAQKLANFTASSSARFTGPLVFLNSYTYIMSTSLLTGLGASQEFLAGATFWNRYGRTLYNATAGQLAYNASLPDGSARPKPVLRTTGQSRIENSEINWALGFFGPSFEAVPNPTLANATSPFEVVIIPEGGTENNTLASYDSCFNDIIDSIGAIGDSDLFVYASKYLVAATARLQQYAPQGLTLNTNDTYAMQSICAYETQYIGSSDFCTLFTEDEWAGFEASLEIEYFYDYSYGNPTGMFYQRQPGHSVLTLPRARSGNRLCPGADCPPSTPIHHRRKLVRQRDI